MMRPKGAQERKPIVVVPHSPSARKRMKRTEAPAHLQPEHDEEADEAEEDVEDYAVREELQSKILELLQKRAATSTMCPSEAPRAIEPANWRPLMDTTREVARQMALDGRIEITQKGRVVDPTAPLRGPIRLRMATSKAPPPSSTPGQYCPNNVHGEIHCLQSAI